MNLKRLGINVILVLAERFLQLIVGMVCISLIAKKLSVYDNGQYAYAVSLGTIFVSFGMYLSQDLLTAKLSRYRYLISPLMTTAFYMRVMYHTFATLLALIYGYFFIEQAGVFWVVLGLCMPAILNEAVQVYGAWFSANGLTPFISLARLLGFVSRLLLTFYLINQTWVNYQHFILTFVLESLLTSSCLLLLYYKHPLHLHISLNFKYFKKKLFKILMRQGVWIGLSITLGVCFTRLDRILLETQMNYANLAFYASATQLNDAWLNLGYIFVSIIAPMLIFRQTANQANSVFIKSALAIMGLISLGALLLNYFSGFIIHFIFGERYNNSIELFSYMLWLAPFACLNQFFNLWWIHNRKYLYSIYTNLLAALTLVTLFFACIKYFNQAFNLTIDLKLQMIYLLALSYTMALILQIFLYQRYLKIYAKAR